MKQLSFVLAAILLPTLIFAAEVSPTPVPGTVKIAVILPTENINGAAMPQIDKAIAGLFTSASFIYNDDNTRVVVILEVLENNAAKVENIMQSQQNEITSLSADEIEAEFEGYKKYMGIN